MKFFFILLTTVAVLTACNETPNNAISNETNTTDTVSVPPTANLDTSSRKSAFSIEPFSNLPANVEGCACYFSSNEAAFKEGKFVYTDNANNVAFINLNGTLTQLNQKSNSLRPDKLVKLFANDQFEVKIDVLNVGQLGDTIQYKGAMTLQPKQGAPVIQFVYGECRC